MNQGNDHHDHDGPHQHDLGLSHDLPTVLTRRRAGPGPAQRRRPGRGPRRLQLGRRSIDVGHRSDHQLRRDPERRIDLRRRRPHRDPRGDRRPFPADGSTASTC